MCFVLVLSDTEVANVEDCRFLCNQEVLNNRSPWSGLQKTTYGATAHQLEADRNYIGRRASGVVLVLRLRYLRERASGREIWKNKFGDMIGSVGVMSCSN